MNVNDAIRGMYRARRYMATLTEDELRQRFIDTSNILLTLSPEGKISLVPVEPAERSPWSPFIHVLEELRLRGLDWRALGGPVFRDRFPTPKATSACASR